MYPRTMSLDTEGKNRFRVPTIIGFINETSAKPLSSDEVEIVHVSNILIS